MSVDQVHDIEENIWSPRYVHSYHTPGHSTQQMRPGIGQNASCALSDWLTHLGLGAVHSLGSCHSLIFSSTCI